MILIENSPGGVPALFDTPRAQIRAETADEVMPALAALDAAQAEGRWIAGTLSYEAGYALEDRLSPLMPAGRRLPLLAFGICDGPLPAGLFLQRAHDEAPTASLDRAAASWSAEDHATAFARVLDYIRAGDIYQVNLTMRMRSRRRGSALGLYGALRARQPVGHGAFVALPDMPTLISRSPELFFETDPSGRIETRPMNGTTPRASNPAHDAALKLGLRNSATDTADHHMTVPLLRNYLSRF